MALTMEDLADVIGEEQLKTGLNKRIGELKEFGSYWWAVYQTLDANARHMTASDLPAGATCMSCRECIATRLADTAESIQRLQAKLDGAKAAIIGEPIPIKQRRNGKR